MKPFLPGKLPMKFVVAVVMASLLLLTVTPKLPAPGLTTFPAILNLLTGKIMFYSVITITIILTYIMKQNLLTILYILFILSFLVSISNHLVCIGDEGFFNRPGQNEYVS